MGLLGTTLAFGAGYATGMKLGDKPMEKVRETTRQMRGRTGTASTVDLRPVTEIMSTTVETVPGGTNLVEATQRMARADIGDVLVVDSSGALRGIITDRDIAIRVVAEGQDPQDVRVADGMSSAVSVRSDATVEEAMQVMRQHDIRRIPVDTTDRPIGVISLGDLSTSPKARSVLADVSAAPRITNLAQGRRSSRVFTPGTSPRLFIVHLSALRHACRHAPGHFARSGSS
jgi:CBS domain-containing protein